MPFTPSEIDDGFEFAAPVGSLSDGAAPCGALDMVGNVAEWVDSGDPAVDLHKGGSFHQPLEISRPQCAWRVPAHLRLSGEHLGFRAALSAGP